MRLHVSIHRETVQLQSRGDTAVLSGIHLEYFLFAVNS